MKKLLSIITVVLYFIMTSGVMINEHYCMGRYQSFDLYAAAKDTCGKCGMQMDKSHGCCKDEVKVVKLQVDQNTTTISYSFKDFETPAIIPSEFIAASAITSANLPVQENHAPPELSDQDAYLQNGVFRF